MLTHTQVPVIAPLVSAVMIGAPVCRPGGHPIPAGRVGEPSKKFELLGPQGLAWAVSLQAQAIQAMASASAGVRASGAADGHEVDLSSVAAHSQDASDHRYESEYQPYCRHLDVEGVFAVLVFIEQVREHKTREQQEGAGASEQHRSDHLPHESSVLGGCSAGQIPTPGHPFDPSFEETAS